MSNQVGQNPYLTSLPQRGNGQTLVTMGAFAPLAVTLSIALHDTALAFSQAASCLKWPFCMQLHVTGLASLHHTERSVRPPSESVRAKPP